MEKNVFLVYITAKELNLSKQTHQPTQRSGWHLKQWVPVMHFGQLLNTLNIKRIPNPTPPDGFIQPLFLTYAVVPVGFPFKDKANSFQGKSFS